MRSELAWLFVYHLSYKYLMRACFEVLSSSFRTSLSSTTLPYYMKFWRHFNLAILAIFQKIAKLKCTKLSVAKFQSSLNLSECNMKFRHLVRFTRSRYFTVDYEVYRMSTCIHFSHLVISTSRLKWTLRTRWYWISPSHVDYAVSTFIKTCGFRN